MRTALACAITALLCTAVTATAATLITGRQIKNGTITSADIRNGSVAVADLRRSARPAAGPPGVAGPQGPQGPKGDPGNAAPPPAIKRAAARQLIPAGETSTVQARCPEGFVASSGGFSIGNPTPDSEPIEPVVLNSEPAPPGSASPGQWQVTVRNRGSGDLIAAVTARCTQTPS